MGLFAKGGEDDDRPVSNPRAASGPPEGEPGETKTIMVTHAFPPQVIVAVVQEDGWFSDEVYAQLDAGRTAR